MRSVILVIAVLTFICSSLYANDPKDLYARHKILQPEFPAAEYKTEYITLPGGVPMEFIWIPPGVFCMGSNLGIGDSMPHTVEITTGFWLGKYEVTQAQWFAILKHNPSHFKGANLPVEQVTWNNAQVFLSAMNTLKKGQFRLPTEAEWEYACRADTETEYYWGNEMNEEYCFCDGTSDNKTHDVGSTTPNNWGFYDMSGNVCEWVSDWYDRNYYKVSPLEDPAGPEGPCRHRVFRGGGWRYFQHNCRSASRGFGSPDNVYSNFGLRLAADKLIRK